MVIKNKRTQEIIDLIEKFGCADATQIQRLFYTYSNGIVPCRAKLKALVEEGTLKRERSDINSKYIYWIGKKPVQIQHALLVLECYISAKKRYGTVDCQLTELGFGIRPDALIKANNKQKFVEVHLSNNELNLEKYLVLRRKWQGIFPDVLVVTNKKVKVSSEVNAKMNVVVTSIERIGEKI